MLPRVVGPSWRGSVRLANQASAGTSKCWSAHPVQVASTSNQHAAHRPSALTVEGGVRSATTFASGDAREGTDKKYKPLRSGKGRSRRTDKESSSPSRRKQRPSEDTTPFSIEEYKPLWHSSRIEDSDSQAQLAQKGSVHSFSHLPDPQTWHQTSLGFSAHETGEIYLAKGRFFMSNRISIAQFVDGLGLEDIVKQNNGQKVTIIEAFSGAGTITQELLRRPEVGRVIAFEDTNRFEAAMKSLAEDPTIVDSEGVPSKDKLIWRKENGYAWESYVNIENDGLLDGIPQPIADPSHPLDRPPPLVFVAQMPNTVHGDLFFTQLIAAMGHGQWLFKFGRVKLAFVVSESMASKSMAAASESQRARIGTLANILSTQDWILKHDEALEPQERHIYPPRISPGRRSFVIRQISNDHLAAPTAHRRIAAVSAVPKVRQLAAWRKNALEKMVAEGSSPSIDTGSFVERDQNAIEEEGLRSALRLEAAHRNKHSESRQSEGLSAEPVAFDYRPEWVNVAISRLRSIDARRRQQLMQLGSSEANESGQSSKSKANRRYLTELGVCLQQFADQDLFNLSSLAERSLQQRYEASSKRFVSLADRVLRYDTQAFATLRAICMAVGHPSAADVLEERRERGEELDQPFRTPSALSESGIEEGEVALEEALAQRASTTDASSAEGGDTALANSSKREGGEGPILVQGLTGQDFESLDYLLRSLFVLRITPIQEALNRTYPGAASVLNKLAPPGTKPIQSSVVRPLNPKLVPPGTEIDPQTKIVDLTDEQWISLARMFERWPFRPERLFEDSKIQMLPGTTKSTGKREPTHF